MSNFHTNEWIQEKVMEHLEEAKEHFTENHIVGIFLQGSQNYGMDYINSDIDTKLIITPTLEDLVNADKCASNDFTGYLKHKDELNIIIENYKTENPLISHISPEEEFKIKYNIVLQGEIAMGMTMTQKILAAHAGLDSVVAGQLIEAKLDLCHGNDITTPVAIKEFNNC